MQFSLAKFSRITISFILVVIVVIAVYFFWSGKNSDQDKLTLYGNIDQREVELAFLIQERIVRLHVEEGDHVKAGQLMAEVDQKRFELAVAQQEAELEVMRQQLAELEHGSRPEEIRRSRAELDVAEATAHDAELSYQRVKSLVEKKLTSKQDADDARAALDAARANVKAARESLNLVEQGPRQENIAAAQARVIAAEAALAYKQKDLVNTRLYAPENGVVQARILEPGDIAGPQKPVFTLAITDPLWVRAYVSEPNLGKLDAGMQAEVFTDSFPDKVYQGHIGYISTTAEFTPKSVQTTDLRSSLVYQVRILVKDPASELRLGMPVTVVIPLAPVAMVSGEGVDAR